MSADPEPPVIGWIVRYGDKGRLWTFIPAPDYTRALNVAANLHGEITEVVERRREPREAPT
jgi:hypothetical protein